MNLGEALIIVRNCSLSSPQMKHPQGQKALKVVDKKIQSLMRKQSWRTGNGATPIHMGRDGFLYPIPETKGDR